MISGKKAIGSLEVIQKDRIFYYCFTPYKQSAIMIEKEKMKSGRCEKWEKK